MVAELAATDRGFTVADIARRYRVGEDRVRTWIKTGVLKAINTAAIACGKPRYVVTAEALTEFEKVRAVATPPKSKLAKRRKANETDYFPD